MTRIIYLGSPESYDRHLARVLLSWLHANTGNRGLIVVHEQARV